MKYVEIFYVSYTISMEIFVHDCYMSSDNNSNVFLLVTNNSTIESERFKLKNCACIILVIV